MSKPYTILADNYDYMLRHVEYNEWYFYLKSLMLRHVENPKKILEIGTGTGKFGVKFSSDNYQILGIDISFEMLKIAAKRAIKNFKILCADVRNFYLKEKFDFIFSVHDTFNYLLTKKELEAAFLNVKKIMNSESIFMFDITTEYNIHRYFHMQSETYFKNGYKIVWSNEYNKKDRIISSFIKFDDQKGNIETEVHTQKIHTIDEISHLLNKCGFEIEAIYSDYSFEPCSDETIMINFVTRIK